MKKILSCAILSSLLVTGCAFGGCSKKPASNASSENLYDPTANVRIEMEDGGVIELELYGNLAPITVENFIGLIEDGFYDGLYFHRVIENFMIQCGDPTGTGMGGSSKTIKGEFALNGVANDLSHKRGVISMGRKGNSYDSASSHFFICHADAPHLDGQYAAFGRVTSGMETVDAIATCATDANDRPLYDQTIKAMTVTSK